MNFCLSEKNVKNTKSVMIMDCLTATDTTKFTFVFDPVTQKINDRCK